MRQKNRIKGALKGLLLLCFTGVLLSSCLEDTSCGQNIETGMLFSAYTVTIDSATQERVVTRDMSRLYVFLQRDRMDTLYPRVADTLAMVPLELTDSITSLFFEKDSVLNEIKIIHTLPEVGFVDVNCGFVPTYTITNGSFSNIELDSVQIVNPTVDTDVFKTNILLFY